ncbi:hypothetical protein EBO34_07650 [Alteribacter keqinensis]|uniref:Uncharacterized protein n=1 Tax=Alteribacter keqinensis TaxID=2483800 RepID=A0A3M7TW47_9BACI|nr:hypothetical protein EBO34_07650 [Alteribacter keqinensis]
MIKQLVFEEDRKICWKPLFYRNFKKTAKREVQVNHLHRHRFIKWHNKDADNFNTLKEEQAAC